MVSEELRELQEEFERKQISGGLEKLHENTSKLEKQVYASATVYGSSTIKSILLPLMELIEKKKEHHRKYASKDAVVINKYLLPVDTGIQALLVCKVVFDHAFAPRQNKQTVTATAAAVGHAIEGECQMTYYDTEAPALFTTLKKNYWHQSKGTESKRKTIQTLMHKKNITPWVSWDISTKVKIGTFLINCLCELTKWFVIEPVRKGRKTINILSPSEELIAHTTQVMEIAGEFSPLAKPMLIPPRNWYPLQDGGYYLNDLTKCHRFIRKTGDGLIQGEIPYDFINKIQQVKYRLNPFSTNVAEALEERGIPVGKFRPVIDHPIPPKPVDIDTNEESRRQWRKEKTVACNAQAAEVRKSCRTRMTMNCVREFKGKDFFHPFSFDYRGRAYPISSVLSPQDTDFGKSLLIFAEGAPINEVGERWIKFQLATCYGLDKATMDERIAWVNQEDNAHLVERVATNPLDNIADWENADEPWQFLVAAEEYYRVCVTRERTHTHLPIAVDATCSGLQILAGMAKDAKTAKMVNVIGSSKPQDAYKVVAEHSINQIPERLRPYWDRKTTKRCVMVIPYNAKPYSNRSYIREAFKEKGITVDKEELTQCVAAVRGAMNIIVPGPMQVMKWIETEVGKAIKRGDGHIEWTTPSGFKVKQRLMKRETKVIRTQLMGRCEVHIAGAEIEVDLKHHKNATAPNLIHSLDASLLHFSATEFKNRPIATIHDSVLCRATDMCILSTLVRKIYMRLFAEHSPLEDFALAIRADTQPPIIGDLQPSEVIESTYFFC